MLDHLAVVPVDLRLREQCHSYRQYQVLIPSWGRAPGKGAGGRNMLWAPHVDHTTNLWFYSSLWPYVLSFSHTDQYFKWLYFPNCVYQVITLPISVIINHGYIFWPASDQHEINNITTLCSQSSAKSKKPDIFISLCSLILGRGTFLKLKHSCRSFPVPNLVDPEESGFHSVTISGKRKSPQCTQWWVAFLSLHQKPPSWTETGPSKTAHQLLSSRSTLAPANISPWLRILLASIVISLWYLVVTEEGIKMRAGLSWSLENLFSFKNQKGWRGKRWEKDCSKGTECATFWVAWTRYNGQFLDYWG